VGATMASGRRYAMHGLRTATARRRRCSWGNWEAKKFGDTPDGAAFLDEGRAWVAAYASDRPRRDSPQTLSVRDWHRWRNAAPTRQASGSTRSGAPFTKWAAGQGLTREEAERTLAKIGGRGRGARGGNWRRRSSADTPDGAAFLDEGRAWVAAYANAAHGEFATLDMRDWYRWRDAAYPEVKRGDPGWDKLGEWAQSQDLPPEEATRQFQ